MPNEAEFWAKMVSGAHKERKAKVRQEARTAARGEGKAWDVACAERLQEMKAIDSSLRATRARCSVEMRGILGTVKACRMIYLAGERRMASEPVAAEPLAPLDEEGYGHLRERLDKMAGVVNAARQEMLQMATQLYHELGQRTCEEEEAAMEQAWSSLRQSLRRGALARWRQSTMMSLAQARVITRICRRRECTALNTWVAFCRESCRARRLAHGSPRLRQPGEASGHLIARAGDPMLARISN